jgi:hypothetical protein
MKTRTIITIILLVFVAASVAYLVIDEMRKGETEAADESASTADGTEHKVVAYYFHGDKRCRTCLSIEAYTREAIERGFPEELESGELELRIVNVDEPENGHFVQDYGLTTKSVILADFRGGAEERWKNLDMIWEYVRDKEVFVDYVRGETEEFLGGTPHE